MKKKGKISTGLFIPRDMLERGKAENIFRGSSALWKSVGAGEAKGVNGRDHDRYLYDEEK
jgi:hypothetical protein